MIWKSHMLSQSKQKYDADISCKILDKNKNNLKDYRPEGKILGKII